MEPINCNRCGKEIPEGRLKALPNTTSCVNCSTIKPKRPVILQLGEGDHTYNETIFLESEEYDKYMDVLKTSKTKSKLDKLD